MRVKAILIGLVLILSCTSKQKTKDNSKKVYSGEFASRIQRKINVLKVTYPKNYSRFQKIEKKLLELLEYPESQKEIIDEIKVVIKGLENLRATDFDEKSIQARLLVFKSMLLNLELQVFGEKNSKNLENNQTIYLSESELSFLVQFFIPIKQAMIRIFK